MISVNEKDGSRVAVIEAKGIILSNVDSALDLMGDMQAVNCNKIAIAKENISDDFFELKTKIAGEILQKYSNYRKKIAVFGDFEKLISQSRSLRDFIYECNKGTQVFFVPTKEEALERLHGVD